MKLSLANVLVVRDSADVPGSSNVVAYLSLLVCAVGRVLQCSLERFFRLARSHQLLDLAGECLYILRRDGLDGGGQSREVEVD